VGGLILAWMLGEGIIVWRSAYKEHKPPIPGQMLAATGLFALCALLAEYEPARGAATAFAFGIDIAVLLKVLPGTGTSSASSMKKAGPAPTPTGTQPLKLGELP
jgi:hypothetical protein